MEKGVVFDIRRYSVHDGPGIRTTVFLKGCPLECAWCHNPEGIKKEKAEITRKRSLNGKLHSYTEVVGKTMSTKEVFGLIEKDRIFYEESRGGVTFSGGEPLMQHRFLAELIAMCRVAGIHTAIDTSGQATAEAFTVVKEADLLLYDLKCAGTGKHKEWTGRGNEIIIKNLNSLSRSGPLLVIRIPLVPGFNTGHAEMAAIKDLLAPMKHRILRIDILPYHKLGQQKYMEHGMTRRMKIDDSPSEDEISVAVRVFESEGYAVKQGG